MVDKLRKTKKELELESKVTELTADLQRTRADFENYRKRADLDKVSAREAGKIEATIKLLPIIDNIDRAIAHTPAELKSNPWAMGIAGLSKSLEKMMGELNIARIEAKPGQAFNPEFHDAVQFDEQADGEHEIIASELQPGYMLDGEPIRHAMVRVTRK